MKLIFSVTLLLSLLVRVEAQSENSNTVNRHFLLQNDVLIGFTGTTVLPEVIQTFSQTQAMGDKVLDVTGQEEEIRDVAAVMNPDRAFIYVIKTFGFNENLDRYLYGAPTVSQLFRWDIATAQETLLVSDKNVLNVFPSPDGSRAIVIFYDGAYLNSRLRACIFDLRTSKCTVLSYPYVATYVEWVDSNRFTIGISDDNPNLIRLVNSITLEQEILAFPSDWYIYATQKLIPKTQTLLVAATSKIIRGYPPTNFLTYDLNTKAVTILPYSTLPDGKFGGAITLDLSPNKSFLVYGTNEQTALVDFRSGELITRLDSASALDWLSDSSLLIQGSRENELQVYALDIPTGTTNVLLRGEEAIGILLSADRP